MGLGTTDKDTGKETSYLKISPACFVFSKTGISVQLNLLTFESYAKSKASTNTNETGFLRANMMVIRSLPFEIDVTNHLKTLANVYLYLKTLPEYSTYLDVFEEGQPTQ